jgi:hypothetical protein
VQDEATLGVPLVLPVVPVVLPVRLPVVLRVGGAVLIVDVRLGVLRGLGADRRPGGAAVRNGAGWR